MCGIVGFERKLANSDLTQYQSLLKHRGPDGTGYFQDETFSFIHWRLSIIDLSTRASQPFHYENLVLIFNGEIYNYREVGVELEKSGYSLETQSDSEVLIKAFHLWGANAVNRFVGMFAFSVYNKQTKEIFLFRDRLGVKPLYYSLTNGLSFGSEMKVFRILKQSLSIDPIALNHYFKFGYVPGERTIFKEVKKLLPGHYLRFHSGIVEIKNYWSISVPSNNLALSLDECSLELEKILTSSFQYRMVADVPVGIFLSGGIDSSLLATLLQKNSSAKIKTFTIGFDHAKFDEMPHAKKIAERIGTEHVELKLGIDKAGELFDQFYEIYDEPFSDTSGIPTALVSLLAKQHGAKVVLSADGADEFFGGYPHYQLVASWWKKINATPPPLRKAMSSFLNFSVPSHLRSKVTARNFGHRIDRIQSLLDGGDEISFFESSIANQSNRALQELTGNQSIRHALLQLNEGMPQEKMMYWDANYYLPDDLLVKVDRATMHYGVEGREPFLDHRMIEFAQQLPMSMKINGTESKYILRKILYKYHPSSLFDRPKQGFSIPIFSWFSQKLDQYFDSFLNDSMLSQIGILNVNAVKTELRKYRAYKLQGRDYNIEKMWRILSFAMWYNRWVK